MKQRVPEVLLAEKSWGTCEIWRLYSLILNDRLLIYTMGSTLEVFESVHNVILS